MTDALVSPINVPPSDEVGWRFDTSYLRLPESLYSRVLPTPVRNPRLVIFNRPLAIELGLSWEALEQPEAVALWAGNRFPPGAEPLAQAYAGHQYGHFTPLGDGRAILIGEQLAPDGRRFDVQWKGPGPTPYSRRGDGRAALGPMLREYIISEAMHNLGIPTTRSLAVAATGEPVMRETILPGAVLTRVAASHLRVGTFEWAAALRDPTVLKSLADYTLRRHYPGLANEENPNLALLDAIVRRQAALIAQWQCVGFIHGVMNTDNMAISGETLDFGPCAFMDAYDPATVFSSIDHHGRYAYGNQPRIAQWNLARLAEAMLPLIHKEEARAIELATPIVSAFSTHYAWEWLSGMRRKLGLFTEESDDLPLAESLLAWMHARQRDFTNTFQALSPDSLRDPSLASDPEFMAWHERWRTRRTRQPQTEAEVAERMLQSNPAVIPRNHRVEEALQAASVNVDFGPLHALMEVLANPFVQPRDEARYMSPAGPDERVCQTFCGT